MVVKAPGVGEKALTLASIVSDLSLQLIFKSSFEILGANVAILLSCSINSEEWCKHLLIEDSIRSAPASLSFLDKEP